MSPLPERAAPAVVVRVFIFSSHCRALQAVSLLRPTGCSPEPPAPLPAPGSSPYQRVLGSHQSLKEQRTRHVLPVLRISRVSSGASSLLGTLGHGVEVLCIFIGSVILFLLLSILFHAEKLKD